mmetsp:Transcript_28241/g.36512  ORF Transcript_28241/g.36512 Transcript_28241/m.36512 type:complete len:86 (+) Transcript_28241:474-731(+)
MQEYRDLGGQPGHGQPRHRDQHVHHYQVSVHGAVLDDSSGEQLVREEREVVCCRDQLQAHDGHYEQIGIESHGKRKDSKCGVRGR